MCLCSGVTWGGLDSYVQLGGGWDSTVLLESRQYFNN